MNYDLITFNRQPLRFTSIKGEPYVSLSDVLTIANTKRPDNLTTINSSIITEYGYNPIELISVTDAIELIKSSNKSNTKLITILESRVTH
ncbi:MAG: hypothetical protein HZT40_04120 [Candidatus Thiothrix singaporensis]|uniref:Bro-N domain-containing protein n=1 Tax=Candidatus Thiothrix singaporensis TaxID=2799669 RepID=A0A7L6APA5_9GAMM|nr:MAG: hypothetical protein HZT40_04120 [Candidatus Thiothrix singaporensis]